MAARRWEGAVSFEKLSQTEREQIRGELGVRRAPATDSQPKSAALTDIAGLAKTDGNVIVGNGTNWVAESGATARTSLGAQAALTQQAAIANPAGGATTDAEARAAIVSILTALRTLGLIAT
jgi:hypothetical protein